MSSPQHLDAGRRHQGKERLISPNELEVVEAGLGSDRIGHAIKEVEGTGTGFHRIRRHQLVRNRRRIPLRDITAAFIQRLIAAIRLTGTAHSEQSSKGDSGESFENRTQPTRHGHPKIELTIWKLGLTSRSGSQGTFKDDPIQAMI